MWEGVFIKDFQGISKLDSSRAVETLIMINYKLTVTTVTDGDA